MLLEDPSAYPEKIELDGEIRIRLSNGTALTLDRVGLASRSSFIRPEGVKEYGLWLYAPLGELRKLAHLRAFSKLFEEKTAAPDAAPAALALSAPEDVIAHVNDLVSREAPASLDDLLASRDWVLAALNPERLVPERLTVRDA